MYGDKESQSQCIQFKCPAYGWNGSMGETASDEMLGIERCPNCSNYELKKIMQQIMNVPIKTKRPILKLPSKVKVQNLNKILKQSWQKPKVTDEVECHGVSPTHVSTLK